MNIIIVLSCNSTIIQLCTTQPAIRVLQEYIEQNTLLLQHDYLSNIAQLNIISHTLDDVILYMARIISLNKHKNWHTNIHI